MSCCPGTSGGYTPTFSPTPSGARSILVTAGINDPRGLAFDKQGNLIVANSGNGTIEEFDSHGNETLLATAHPSNGALSYLAVGSASVPEPSSLILLAAGAIGFLTIARPGTDH